jgi:Flp pilus assembly protein TadG
MRGTVFSRLRRGAKKLLRDQRGNAFMLTAAAIVPVIGIVGSAVDIGRAYMTQLRLQQACDSGVLAGRRAMASGTYSEAAQAEASKMFNFNFPEEKYGSTGISFSSRSVNASDVEGSASAILPTALMYIFGQG